jgi:hypothetical protein
MFQLQREKTFSTKKTIFDVFFHAMLFLVCMVDSKVACFMNKFPTKRKRKKSLQRLKDAKRCKKLEKRNLPTVYSDDDLGDLTDSFSSQCSSHDSDDLSD